MAEAPVARSSGSAHRAASSTTTAESPGLSGDPESKMNGAARRLARPIQSAGARDSAGEPQKPVIPNVRVESSAAHGQAQQQQHGHQHHHHHEHHLHTIKHKHVAEASRLALSQARNSLIFFFLVTAVAALFPASTQLGQFARYFFMVQDIDAAGTAGVCPCDALFALSALFMVVLARALVTLTVMHHIGPAMGIGGSGKRLVRFAEQSWCLVYYAGLWAAGTVLLRVGDYSLLDPTAMWADFPHVRVPAAIKAYYLIAIGYWTGQLYIIHVEERRHDHYQMFLHHVVTCMLIVGSYAYNYTRIGHIILVVMDFVDAQLSLAKLLKYCELQRLCDIAFLAFLVGWVALRHVLFIYQLHFAAYIAPRSIPAEVFCPANRPWATNCYSSAKHQVFAWLLVVLQGITLAWLYFILRVVARVVRGQSAEDNRSDESSEETDDDGDDDGGANNDAAVAEADKLQ